MVAALFKKCPPEWISAYNSGASMWEIARGADACGQTVVNWLRRGGVTIRSKSDAGRRIPINQDAFLILDAQASYWLGLLYADGCITEDKYGIHRVALIAHIDDRETIDGFLQYLGRPIGNVRKRPDKEAIQISIAAKFLADRLIGFGVVPRKTHTIAFPDFLPAGTVSDFVRGYFDGDGSVWTRLKPRYLTPQVTASFAGNPRFIEGLAAALETHVGLRAPKLQIMNEGKSASARYEGRDRLVRLYDWLYAGTAPRLSRKHTRFSEGLWPAGYAACGADIACK